MALKLHDDAQADDSTELERFGREYDETARPAGQPLWNELPDLQQLAIVVAGKRYFVERDTPERLLTVKKMVELSGLGRNTISRWCAAGILPAKMIAGAYRVPVSAWNALARSGLADGNGKAVALRPAEQVR